MAENGTAIGAAIANQLLHDSSTHHPRASRQVTVMNGCSTAPGPGKEAEAASQQRIRPRSYPFEPKEYCQ